MSADASASTCESCSRATTSDMARHAEWHRLISPLTSADAVTLERAYGRPSIALRTYVDDQFSAARST